MYVRESQDPAIDGEESSRISNDQQQQPSQDE